MAAAPVGARRAGNIAPMVRGGGGTTAPPETRFAFGANWSRFLHMVDEDRIAGACASIESVLGAGALLGAGFLDAGCGSGLFSLSAVRLGATRVHSFDLDPQSVACAQELRRRFAPEAEGWRIEHGDVLDVQAMDRLGTWDVVYSWGVLHHTGDLWRGLDNVAAAVAPGGRLFVSVYNDQGKRSRLWRQVKRRYNLLPQRLRVPYAVAVMLPWEALAAGWATVRGHPGTYLGTWFGDRGRGMSRWHDLLDWVGGYPFDVARPEDVFHRLRDKGFSLTYLKTCGGGIGCNEFLFTAAPAGS